MIEVFKTNVQKIYQAEILVELLLQNFPTNKINFDLEDCDKILRVEGENISTDIIIQILNKKKYKCEVLE